MTLLNAIQTRTLGENTVADEFNKLIPAIKDNYNSDIAPRLLSWRRSESLPTSPKAASSFRARVSLLVEYSVIQMLERFLREDSGELHVTFNIKNEFADFFIRDEAWRPQIYVDIKTLHDESREASARFTTPFADIREFDDYVMFLAWQWQEVDHGGIPVMVPWLIDGLFVPAIEIGRERDLRQAITGGSFDPTGMPLAKGGNRDTNYGKWNRIVHDSRKDAPDLHPYVARLLHLMDVQMAARTAEPPELLVVEALADQDASSEAVTDLTDDA